MRDLELEKTLRQWAEDMVKRYTWLTIRAYLISYSPESKADEDERFVIESSAFEDRINEQYDGLKAPLFCYEERLFKLSPTAEVVRHHKPEKALPRIATRKKQPQGIAMAAIIHR